MQIITSALDVLIRAFVLRIQELPRLVLEPGPGNYLYLLIGVSLFFWAVEAWFPWRKKQSLVRRDFWLDGFYMFFNLFIFPALGFFAVASACEYLFNQLTGLASVSGIGWFQPGLWPDALRLLVMFVIRDFLQWNVHVMLHRFHFLWEFHKVHHSVREMGFAAHLRYHWIENILYRMVEYLPLRLLGFGIGDYFLVYAVSLFLGHFNHTNVRIPLGPLKYVLNNPQMHIWHHARDIPRPYGVNFGLSLSLWDYLFGTAYVPHDGRDEDLGFENVEQFPQSFLGQLVHGLKRPGIVR